MTSNDVFFFFITCVNVPNSTNLLMFLFSLFMTNTHDPCTLFWTSATILGSTSQAMTYNSDTDSDSSCWECDIILNNTDGDSSH